MRRETVSPRSLIMFFCGAEILAISGFGAIPALLPLFFDLWHLSGSDAGWLNGAYFGGYMLAVPLLVGLTDRYDARGIFLLGCGLSVVSALGLALLAQDFASALPWRILAGAALAGTYMTGLRALTDRVAGTGGQSSRAVSFYTASFSAGSALSYFLTGYLAEIIGWRGAIALLSAGPAFSILLIWLGTRKVSPGGAASLLSSLDFRPALKHKRLMAYVWGYTFHTWETIAMRSFLVAFIAFAATHNGTDALLSPPAIAMFIILLGDRKSVV